MFTPQGPTLRELAVQALSSTEHGYDLLAPKFDLTPFRTPEPLLDATVEALRPFGPFGAGLDLCCGTGAGTGVLRQLCAGPVVGVDFSAGMLGAARAGEPDQGPATAWVRADARRLPFRQAFDLVLSFGAFGHFQPGEWPALFGQAYRAVAPGGLFAFPIAAPPRVGSRPYLALGAFDAVMRVRNALWRPPFVMYYRPFQLSPVRAELERAGFAVRTLPLLGRLADGSPRYRLVLARRQGTG
ncbi:class I SAM-dependent methyltransferase [Streptacidiphilus sp. P02-A3a]|uniref:class I SAM-dependent methyltransferase n=1 Tax=Streptacidiphilus sp. P02-A3a TaxID=2704468 RepID=UPI0015FD4BD8|nr:class I SAM-dependent methyltransferase [Streptacidiphilus sp. P02-A3a]QMU69483.1 class I SAM-dependent methyltransferase [Streptacidiphilus sp. P02-A3a]